jgi:hypothetical protein
VDTTAPLITVSEVDISGMVVSGGVGASVDYVDEEDRDPPVRQYDLITDLMDTDRLKLYSDILSNEKHRM